MTDLNNVLLNELRAGSLIAEVQEATIRNLLRWAMGEARGRIIKRVGESDVDLMRRFPEQPFDMVFFVTVLKEMFSKEDILRQVLDGKDLDVASGWNLK